jgi:hypothetical protein
MSQWGTLSFENDEVMDRVGDIVRYVFEGLSTSVISHTVVEFYKKQSNCEALALWTMCTIELPEDKIRRLGFLLASDPNLAKDFIRQIDRGSLDEAIRRCAARFSKEKLGIASYFAHELGCAVPSEIRDDAIARIRQQISQSADSQKTACLVRELNALEKT